MADDKTSAEALAPALPGNQEPPGVFPTGPGPDLSFRQPVMGCSNCGFKAEPDTLGAMGVAFESHVCADNTSKSSKSKTGS